MDEIRPIMLDHGFFCQPDVTFLARMLLGKYVFTVLDQRLTGGQIVETEAYKGIHDRASHAFGGRRTKRTEIMYSEGGVAYVYLCYGIHFLFNIVTNAKDIPDAILIRGLLPTHGLSHIEHRLGRHLGEGIPLHGPGLVSKALGITTRQTGIPLKRNFNGASIWLEDRGIIPAPDHIQCLPRIGVGYAGTDALLPYRYVWTKKNTDAKR